MSNDTTVRFKADISQLKSQMQAAERQIKLVNSEFKAATAGMDDWTKSAEGLSAKTKQLSSVLDGQNKKLELMEKELEATVKAYGENSAAADRVRIKINEQKAAIAKTESQLQSYEKKLSDLSDTMDNAADGSEEFISASDKLKKSISDQEDKLESLKKHYSDLVLEGEGLSDEAENTAKEIKELSSELQENKSKLEDADKAADEFDDSLNEMDDAADKASDGFTVMKGALADLVADGIRATIDAVKDLAKETFEVGSNFEEEMSKVAAISGANAEEMEKLTAKAEEMGSISRFSATESAEAFEFMSMAGWKTEDMLDGIAGIMNLAAASGTDLATTSDIVTDALTAMGYEAKDAAHLADVMAAASSNANTNVEMMGLTFQYAAPLAGALGYNMEDTAAAIGLMANSGIKADKAGTALRGILTRLAAPPKECAKAMEDLGMSLVDDEGNMKSLAEVMRMLRRAFEGLSEEEQAQYAKHIAGQNAMSGLLAIVNATTEDYEKLTDAVYNSEGAAQAMADTMNDNVSGALVLMKSKIEGIMIKLFNRAKDSMRDGIDTFGKALDKVDWDKVGDAIGDITKKAADFFLYVVNNSDRLINIIKTIGSVMAVVFVSNKIVGVTSAIGGFITALSKAKSATDGLAAVTELLGFNMSALPVMALVGSMAALYSYMQKQEKEYEANAEKTYGLSDAQKELINSIDDSTEAIKRQKEARKETGNNIDTEADRIRDLKNQYNELIDENGKVKDGYQDFAAYLLDELALSLDTTVENIQENIDANGKLGASIDELIEKKKNEAKLAAFESEYTEAVKNELKYFQELKGAKENAKTAQENLTKAQAEYNAAVDELEKYAKNGSIVPWQISEQAGQAQKNLEAAQNSYKEMSDAVTQASKNWGSAQSTIESYQDAMAASTEGNAKKMNDALLSMQYGLVNHTTASKKELDQQFLNTKKDLEDIQELYKKGHVSPELVNDYKRINQLAGAELDKWVQKNGDAAANSVDALEKGLSQGLERVTVTSSELGVGSKLAFINNLGDWGEIGEEKTGDYLDALNSQKGAANKKGGAIGKAATDGLNSESGEFASVADEAASNYIDTLDSYNTDFNATGTQAAGEAVSGAYSQNEEFTNAAEEAANNYKNTIDSHTSDYKKSGENAAQTAAGGALGKLGDFKSAGESASTQYANTLIDNYSKYKDAGDQMASDAAQGASDNASALNDPGDSAANEFISGISANNDGANSAGSTLASEAASGAGSHNGDAENSGKNFAQGFINGIGSLVQEAWNKAYSLAKAAWGGLASGQQEGSPSKLTTQSGVYFGEGYINGIKSMTQSAIETAADLGLDAIKSLKNAQQEGSPSKLTYKSGKNFTQGYINGIASLESKLLAKSKSMVKAVVKQLTKLNNYNFSDVAEKASESYSKALDKKMNYTSGWMQYKNDKMLADFDKTISDLQKASDNEVAALQKASEKTQAQLQKDSEALQKQLTKESEEAQKVITQNSTAEQKRLQKEINKIKEISSSKRTDEQKKQLKSYEAQLKKEQELEKKRIKALQDSLDKEIKREQNTLQTSLKAEQNILKNGTKKIQNTYNKEITKQQKMKSAYQTASTSFMNEFASAMNDYQSAAQELIDSTMDGITTKYQAKYDNLINKQNELIDKLKSAGDLFDLDNVNLMTTADLKMQTEQITRYAKKLKKIKNKVSDELFEQIQSYDMKDGEAFINRLLKMSKSELESFNKAYTDKLNAADSLAEGIYKKDFKQVAADYKKEVNESFKGLDKDLEELGKQCLQGFVNGLTTNTQYMDSSIKTFVSGMIATFKKELGIKSPSRVTKKLGAYTAEGFALGISQNTDKVTKAIDKTIEAAEKNLDFSRLSLIDGFSEALSTFESQAREKLTATMTELGTTYQTKANEILAKQTNLANNLKSSGSIFDLSNANLMTTADLNAQTAQITRYANKLAKIKDKVSESLFEQIQSYDLKDSEEFIDRLLKMSVKELDAYNKAYTKKLETADKVAQKVYSKEMDNVAQEYNREIVAAFYGVSDEFTKMAEQCLQGFANGLSKESKYLTPIIDNFVDSMIATFKKKLGIHSPSKVTKKLGAYTAEGFADGITKNTDMVTAAIDNLTASVEKSFDWSRLSLIDGFTDAMAEFESQAREKLTATISNIGETYQTKADEIFSKQTSLGDRLKTSGSIFDLSKLNIMTTADLKAQTEQITRYANKLEKIKGKVSESLFEQIQSYDIKDGEEFIDRLLKMSAKELDAYNKAYTQKLETADKLAQKLYVKELDKVAQDYNKEIANAFNGLDDELKTIGTQCLKGFVNGLTSDSKYISTSVNGLIDSMIATFKKKLGIKSPSKVTKKLGAYTAEGFADGITKNTDMVTAAIDNLTASVEKSFDWSRLSLIDGFTDAVAKFESEAKETLSDTISKIGDTYETKFNEILDKQDNLAKSLKNTGDLFSLSNANVMKVNDINEQIKELETYTNRLAKIKGKVSSALFEQITSYSVEEGSAFIDRLLSMSDKELKAYSAAYDKKLNLSDQLAQNLYKSDLNKAASSYDSEIEKAFAGLPATLTKIGTQSMQGFLNGLGADSKYFTADVKKIVNNIVSAFKKELGIHSPSKVMQELGEYTGEGFTNGLLSMIQAVKDAAEEISDTVTSALDWQGDISGARGTLKQAAGATGLNRSVGAFEGANTQIINFNQTNNSPKALDRLTLYRQTNNMLFTAKVRLSDV